MFAQGTREQGNGGTRSDGRWPIVDRRRSMHANRVAESRVPSPESRRRGSERGAALVTVLILTVLLTLLGAAMISVTLTEVTIAYNQGDASAALQMADAGISRAMYELSVNAAWSGTGGPVTLGDGTYNVTVGALGNPTEMVRLIQSTGTRSGGRKLLTAAVKVIPRSAIATVLANTTATIGSGSSGLTVTNTLAPTRVVAVQANNALGAPIAMTVNTTGAVVAGGLTANGVISGVNCATWPWRCDTGAGTLPVPDLDLDSAAAASYRNRAISAGLYFKGGDPSSLCTQGGYSFGLGQTQRCWDRYVHDHGGVIGTGIADPVFYVEHYYFGSQPASYTRPTLTPTHRGSVGGNNGGGAATLTINKPGGVVANDVMVAAISVRGGSATTITPPAGWTLVRAIDNGTTIRMAVYFKVATGGEPASYTWTFDSSQKASGGIQAYSNVDTIAPIDAENGQATPSGTQHSTPSITTYSNNEMLVASFSIARGTTFTPPAGMTERYDTASTGGGPPSRTTSEGDDLLQVTAGATGVKTATAAAAAVGVTHILALRGGGPRVDCTDYPTAVDTMCMRAVAAVGNDAFSEFPNSAPNQITGTVVSFRRGTGTVVSGDIVYENLSLRATDFTHRSYSGDPVLLAGGQVQLISSGTPAASRAVEITGMLYTYAGVDNPSGGNLLGSAGVGVDVQHGASLVTLTFNGFMISNGSILVQDTVVNTGTITVQYDAAVVDNLPAVFLPASPQNNAVIPMSWSSRD